MNRGARGASKGLVRTATIALGLLLALVPFLGAAPAHAHPYLAEEAVRTDDARSLPWNGETDFGLVADYDVGARLVPDTLALLTPTAPPLERFETLRRAALYLSPRGSEPQVAMPLRTQLARRLRSRMDREGVAPRVRALARLDAGCFEWLCARDRTLAAGRSGVEEVRAAEAALPEARAEIAFLLYRMGGEQGLDRALAGAVDGTPLAKNLLRYFDHEFESLAALRADIEKTSAETTPVLGFPQPPPVPDADPTVRHSVVLLVPAALTARRAGDALEIGWTKAHPPAVRLDIGHRMVLGTRIDEGVWVGETRVSAHDTEALLGGEPLHAVATKGFLRDLPTPEDGTPVVFRATVQAFETDIPPQHLWSPTSGRYRVLWERTYEIRLR